MDHGGPPSHEGPDFTQGQPHFHPRQTQDEGRERASSVLSVMGGDSVGLGGALAPAQPSFAPHSDELPRGAAVPDAVAFGSEDWQQEASPRAGQGSGSSGEDDEESSSSSSEAEEDEEE